MQELIEDFKRKFKFNSSRGFLLSSDYEIIDIDTSFRESPSLEVKHVPSGKEFEIKDASDYLVGFM